MMTFEILFILWVIPYLKQMLKIQTSLRKNIEAIKIHMHAVCVIHFHDGGGNFIWSSVYDKH